MCHWYARVVGLFTVLLAGPLNALAQQPATAEQYVTIWRLSRNDFYRPDFSQQDLQDIVNSSPPRELTIAPGDTVSSLLKEIYNVSGSYTPAIYSSVLEAVQALNPHLSFNALKPGTTIRLPELPSTGKSQPGPNFLNLVPGVLDASTARAATWSEAAEALRGTFDRVASVGAAAQSELQFFRIPARFAKTYVSVMKASHTLDEFGASGTVDVVLGGDMQSAAPTPLMTPDLADRIRAALAAAPATSARPVVVVVDDSFPDSASFAAAKRFVLDASAVVRRAYTLGDSTYTTAVTNLADSLSPESALFAYPQLRVHSAMIHVALDELAALDNAHNVSIVYLPLAATQVEAAPLIREVIYLGQLLKIYRPQAGRYTADDSQRKKAQAIVEQIIKDNPVLQSAPLQPFTGSQMVMKTDSLYLESLSILLKFYSDASRRPHVLSFSWTVPDLKLDTFFQPGAYGWKVTAAGNGASGAVANVLREPVVQFAYRGLDPGDFLVVANSEGSESRCPSNTFDDPPQVAIIGLAYSGRLDDSMCGTSFSAPRVAWLLAAREVLSGKVPAANAPEQLDLWISGKRNLILSLQHPAGGFFERYSFSVERLLGLGGS